MATDTGFPQEESHFPGTLPQLICLLEGGYSHFPPCFCGLSRFRKICWTSRRVRKGCQSAWSDVRSEHEAAYVFWDVSTGGKSVLSSLQWHGCYIAPDLFTRSELRTLSKRSEQDEIAWKVSSHARPWVLDAKPFKALDICHCVYALPSLLVSPCVTSSSNLSLDPILSSFCPFLTPSPPAAPP